MKKKDHNYANYFIKIYLFVYLKLFMYGAEITKLKAQVKMCSFLLQHFEEVLDLQGSVLAEVSAVDTVPDLSLPVHSPQCPRPDGARHLGVPGAAQLTESHHHVLCVVQITSNLQGETWA